MEAILKDINAVLGVQGSFVCLNDGSVAAQALPDHYADEQTALAARIVTQTFHALETSGQRIAETDLTFGQARLVVKNLRTGMLFILCARSINLPLLNLTANVAARKLTDELKPAQAKAPAATLPPAPEAAPLVTATPAVSAPLSPLFVELESEWQQIMNAAALSKATLREMSALATWVCCPQARALLAPPVKKQLEFAARAGQRDAIRRAFESAGYQTEQGFDEFRNSARLHFTNAARGITAEIYLDTFSMYHQLDLTPFLAQEGATLAETALLLLRLQLVEMSEAGLRELSALLRDHALSGRTEPGKIELPQITRLCADNWGWHKTVTMNLQRVMDFANTAISPEDRTTVIERIRRIVQALSNAPKSLRWQTRARVGENMRWYEIPGETAEQPKIEMRYGD